MLFVSFTKGPGGFPYVLIITAKVPPLIPIDGITLVDHRVFVLGGDQEVFDGGTTFEVSLDAIPSTDLIDTFTNTLCVGYNNASQNNNSQAGSSQAGNTPLADSTISQLDSEASQAGPSQANVPQTTSSASSWEARPSPLPKRHNSPQGSSPREEPNPKWVINLSSKPLTNAQRSVLAKGPNCSFPKASS